MTSDIENYLSKISDKKTTLIRKSIKYRGIKVKSNSIPYTFLIGFMEKTYQ